MKKVPAAAVELETSMEEGSQRFSALLSSEFLSPFRLPEDSELSCDSSEVYSFNTSNSFTDSEYHSSSLEFYDSLPRTVVDPTWFERPIKRLCVSGGTAAFYDLRLVSKLAARYGSQTYYIGKDIDHAVYEVDFYEEAKRVLEDGSCRAFPGLLDYLLQYIGILTIPNHHPQRHGSKPYEILVIRNLRDGCSAFRMLDLKIGQWTASSNWKGKTRLRAARQGVIDSFTNSTKEGFRLEGCDGAPPALLSMNISGADTSDQTRKKAFKQMMQQIPARDVIMHFMDLHQQSSCGAAFLSGTELAEAVLLEVAGKLAGLSVACRRSAIPHKWIGSSVALCFDASAAVARGTPHKDICEKAKVKVNIFDWGRSELNTLEKHAKLSRAQALSHARFWSQYIAGIDRLAWEAARSYRHRFGNNRGWREILIRVVSFFSQDETKLLGLARIQPLQPTAGTTISILEPLTLEYSLEYVEYPLGSRLKGAWRICILRANGLGKANVFVEVVAVSEEGPARTAETAGTSDDDPYDDEFSFRQMTSIQRSGSSVEWCETLEFPVAITAGLLEGVLYTVSPHLAETSSDSLFPCGDVVLNTRALFDCPTETDWPAKTPRMKSVIYLDGRMNDDASVAVWMQRLDETAEGASTSSNHSRARRPNGEVLLHIRQTALSIRLFAGSIVLASTILATGILAWTVRRRIFRGKAFDLAAVLVCILQFIFGPITIMFEFRPRDIKSIGAERCLNLVLQNSSVHRLSTRGLSYILLGVAWFACQWWWWMPMCRTVGLLLCIVGVLLWGAHCGYLRQSFAPTVVQGYTVDRPRYNRSGHSSTSTLRAEARQMCLGELELQDKSHCSSHDVTRLSPQESTRCSHETAQDV